MLSGLCVVDPIDRGAREWEFVCLPWEGSMVALFFTCPDTGRETASGIEIDGQSLSAIRMFSVRLRCQACGELHEFRIADGHFEESQAA